MSSRISGIQNDFFHQLEEPALTTVDERAFNDLDITLELRGAVAQAMKIAERRGISRDRLADELNVLMPYLKPKITKRKIDAWMARSKEDHPIPAYVIPAICVVTRCDLPLREMARSIGFDLADRRELLAKELGELEIQRTASARKIKEIKETLSNG